MQKAVLGVAASMAEAKPILRHVEGLHGIEANVGITAMGKALAHRIEVISLYELSILL